MTTIHFLLIIKNTTNMYELTPNERRKLLKDNERKHSYNKAPMYLETKKIQP